MAITVYDNKSRAGRQMVTVGRRLWLTRDRSRLVEDGDPEANSLYCHPHHRVPLAEFEALGGAALVIAPDTLQQPEPQPEPQEPETTAEPKSEEKPKSRKKK